MRPIVLLALALGAGIGCGGSSAPVPPPTTPAPESAEAEASSDEPDPEAEPEPEPAAPLDPPSVKVTGILPPAEGKEYVRVQVEFANPNDRPCRIKGYTLSWGDFRKRLDTKNFTVPPNQSRERRTRVHPSDGNLDELTVESASADIVGGCVQ